MEFSEIQVGIDLATSVTIIGSAVAFWSQYVRSTKEARQSDKIEKTRATALSKLYDISQEFEDAYMALLDEYRASNLEKYGTPYIGSLEYPAVGYDAEARYASTKRLVNAFSNFSTLVFKRRYTLLPLLDVIDEEGAMANADSQSGGSKTEIWTAILELQKHDIWLGQDYGYLCKLHELLQAIESAAGSDDVLDSDALYALYQTDGTVKNLTNRLLTEEGFRRYIKNIFKDMNVPDEDNELLACYMKNSTSWKSDRVKDEDIAELVKKFLRSYRDATLGGRFYSAESAVSKRLHDSTLLCKDMLIKISALLYKTLRSNNDISYAGVVDKYEEPRYLGKGDILK